MTLEIISKTVYGSRLYGTSTPESDHDYKGVFIPTASEIVAPRIVEVKNFSTGDKTTKNSADDVDEEYFAVHKLMHMLKQGDMVATEMLFARYDDMTPEWDYILQHRHKLVSRKMKGFVGYAQRQANVYGAKGIRLKEVQETITFLKYNFHLSEKLETNPDAEKIIRQFCEGKIHTKVTMIESKGKDVFHLECCDRKVPLTVLGKEALKIYRKVEEEYGARARAAQTGEGIEWKSMMHAVRISHAALDLLTTGKLEYPLKESFAEFLKSIRRGEIEHSIIEKILEENLTEIERLAMTSTILPEEPDEDLMKAIVEKLYIRKILEETKACATTFETLKNYMVL
ncbi:hypothetical protein PHIM7_238 [Sinorhizobium phage phiM7]|uniref:Nucleotidyltransferase n=2 Tax=Emdodecavirus TaxID=1980937 RepID=S5MQ41_9CAUD|nr:nucleotidyltransferase [Sinorhizobium phage phiM12]YP_009601363.1 nucleotidyltransferase [Sinorhizobium phage phiM7]AGR47950.1 hypothetical protein SmphiM12_318 [Sinorhizobium phage phiM12]AKF12783.1 hypothetical protein PHIM7_238 [Sinorhizobium phage phiM7]AKF13144.1 hypothetical protein PHIM19_239 [Sinorhizobium phage phiM19]